MGTKGLLSRFVGMKMLPDNLSPVEDGTKDAQLVLVGLKT